MATKIIIDSASDIDKEEADKLGVILLPIEVSFDNENYLDGFNITKEEFYDKLVKSTNLPKTSQISPLRYREVFEEVVNNGDEAVVFQRLIEPLHH
ncbi:MAG: DegV family protein, partial [Christensenellales bacterium]